jgi:hypothetical protein
MRTVDELRTALGDADTPAGIDLDAVRARAHRRRRTAALAAVAAVAGLAVIVTVPVVLAGPRTPAATPPAGTGSDCPDRYPQSLRNSGPGLGDRLVPFRPDGALVCEYRAELDWSPVPHRPLVTVLTASRVLAAADARSLLARFERGASHPARRCPLPGAAPVIVQMSGSGRTVVLRVYPDGCPEVSNGIRTTYPGIATSALLDLLYGPPARLTCPQGARQEPLRIDRKPSGPLVPVRTELMLVCQYIAGQRDAVQTREYDGQAARDAVASLESRPLAWGVPCPAPGQFSYLVLVRGEGPAVTLVGSNSGCHTLSSGTKSVMGVDWAALLGT